MHDAAEIIAFPGARNDKPRPVRIGIMSEAIYSGIDWLASMGAFKLIREIGDYCHGFEDRRT